jgi:hypothetical protein
MQISGGEDGDNYTSIYLYNILGLSGGGRPFHPFVPSSVLSSIHPSSSSRKKKMMEEEDDDEWWKQQFIQIFMRSNPVVYEKLF